MTLLEVYFCKLIRAAACRSLRIISWGSFYFRPLPVRINMNQIHDSS